MKKIILLFYLCFLSQNCAWVLENHENPHEFTITKPDINEIVGEYKISEKSRKRLNIPKSIADTILIKINSNKTFEFKNIPENEIYENIESFKRSNDKGKWTIEFDQGSWVISITIISQYDGYKLHNANQYHLNRNKPPYQILKIVGEDNWEAIEFDKK